MAENIKKIPQEEIEKFINGDDPMERIVNLDYKYQDNFISIYYRNEKDQKCVRQESFYPFVWATRDACTRLCYGNRDRLKQLMREYSIGVKKLSNTSIDGIVRPEFEDGYMFMFYAKIPMSYQDFLAFFKKSNNPIYGNKDKTDNNAFKGSNTEKQYLVVTPQEQFLIATGKRFFKGYDDYDQLLRLTFDLETTGLNTKKDRIVQLGVRLNRPIPSRPEGFEKIFNLEGETEEEKDRSELKIIDVMFRIIYTFKPDVITAHNGENFDWQFIIDACERLGTTIEAMSSKYFDGESIRKDNKESILKLGGEIEVYRATIVPQTTVTDSLHAVRRAQAIDSNMQRADLKYATDYAGLRKDNRVYTPGDKISDIFMDTEEHYAFNDEDGDWYLYDKNCGIGIKSRIDFKTDKEYEDYLKSIKGKQEDKPFKLHTRNVLMDGYQLVSGRYIIIRYLLDDIYECDKVEWKFNSTNFLICKMLPVPYKKCTTMGTAGQWKALMMAWSYKYGLAIPPLRDTSSFTGGLSRLLKTGYISNVIKLDYNSLYPSIILTWGISDTNDLMNSMLSFLEYVLTTREKYKAQKKAAEKMIDKLKVNIKNGTATHEEEVEFKKAQADFALADGKQAQMKVLGNSFFGSFGALVGAMFPWKSAKCAEQTTCTGRQSLRLMIGYFSTISERYNLNDNEYNYEPIVGDTDGFNFKLPKKYRYTKENPYIGKGSNREVKLGKEYVDYEADVAEFNDLFMNKVYSPNGVQKMGLGIDEIVSSTINFSRKNYADHFPDNPYPKDVKLVGNTIKSKKMPEYIAKFLAVGIRQLLRGEGQKFLDEYYNYIERIYNFKIPLRDIATKGKIKKSVEQYLKDVKEVTKAGRPKSRQAWYELAIKEGMHVDNGDTLYYINTGKSKSHADVKKVTHYYENSIITGKKNEVTKDIEKEYKLFNKEQKSLPEYRRKSKAEWLEEIHPDVYLEEEIVMNCRLVPRWIIDADDDKFCNDLEEDFEYNCPKYIDMFNKRIKPLLVCFSKSIRNQILISNPNDRKYFTEEQCQLVSGEPNNIGDQDTYEQLMTMEDKEIRFWTKYNMTPPFLEECRMGKWEDIVNDYEARMKREKELGIDKEKATLQEIINTLSNAEINAFLEEGEIPSAILRVAVLDPVTFKLMSKTYTDIEIGSLNDIIERSEQIDNLVE